MTFQTLRTSQRQQHTVTPRLQHAVRLLQLSSLDFAQEVHDAMGRNPFLEVEETAHETAPADGIANAGGIDLKVPETDAVDRRLAVRARQLAAVVVERAHAETPRATSARST